MMDYQEFDVAGNEPSDSLAALLTAARVRFEQRPMTKPGRRSVSVITVHPDDLGKAENVRAEAVRRKNEAFVRTLSFVRRPYSSEDMLLSRVPNDAGYYASHPYHGEPFDDRQYHLVRGGWDHEHCYLCWAKVLPGEDWWATQPANYDKEIGLCLECYARLFGGT
jgi:hypothetical protein